MQNNRNQNLCKFNEGDYVQMFFRTAQGIWKADHLRSPRYAEHDGKRARVVACIALDNMCIYTLRVSADIELQGIPEDCLIHL